MLRRLYLCGILLGIVPAIAGEAPEIAAARTAVKAGLRDPGSARFELVGSYPGAVCGLVNARNVAGGYAGRVPFVYLVAERRAYVLDPASTAGPKWAAAALAAYEGHCPH